MTAFRPAASLPHTGIATFCKAPYVCDPARTVSRTGDSGGSFALGKNFVCPVDPPLPRKFSSRALPVRRDRIKR
jgi:hypothetical protein